MITTSKIMNHLLISCPPKNEHLRSLLSLLPHQLQLTICVHNCIEAWPQQWIAYNLDHFLEYSSGPSENHIGHMCQCIPYWKTYTYTEYQCTNLGWMQSCLMSLCATWGNLHCFWEWSNGSPSKKVWACLCISLVIQLWNWYVELWVGLTTWRILFQPTLADWVNQMIHNIT